MSSQFQQLSNTFNSLLNTYTTTYQDYINAVNSNDNSLTIINNASFNGKANIDVLNNSTINDCKSSCTSNSSCSGATFDNSSSTCTLSSGEGRIISTTGSSAIAQLLLSYSYQLQELNKQLMDVNEEMMNITKNNYNQIQQTKQTTGQQDQMLQNNYNVLLQERSQIEEMVREYETINTAYENGTTNVTSNYLKYIGLLFIVIILLFLLLSLPFSNEQRGGGSRDNSNSKYIYLVFLGFLIVFNASIKKN
jgi:hypothetical protein